MSRPVGPGKPPVDSRFRKGQSGNPKGRPKKARPSPASAFDIVIDRTLTVKQGSTERALTVEEALQLRTYQEAIAGSSAARREVLNMIAKREQYLSARYARGPSPPVEVRFEPEDPSNADKAMLILGIADHDPARQGTDDENPQLLLEPWAVQIALSRGGSARLTDGEVANIKRCTRNAGSLRWPRKAAE